MIRSFSNFHFFVVASHHLRLLLLPFLRLFFPIRFVGMSMRAYSCTVWSMDLWNWRLELERKRVYVIGNGYSTDGTWYYMVICVQVSIGGQ